MEHHAPQRLDMLIAIAECGSLTAAAERLGLTQPALSYRLSKLEQSLGAALFDRAGRGLALNAAGQRALKAAQAIAREVHLLKDDLSGIHAASQSSLRIASHCFTTYRWLPDMIVRLRRQFPNLDLQIVTEATKIPQSFLARQKVDLVLTAYPDTFDHGASRFLFEDEIFALVARDHRLAMHDTIKPRDLSGETLLVYSSQGSPIVNEFIQPAGQVPHALTEMPLTEGMFELARAGLGVAALAGWMLRRQDMDGLVRLRLGRNGLKRRWHVVFDPANESPLLRAAIHEFQQEPQLN